MRIFAKILSLVSLLLICLSISVSAAEITVGGEYTVYKKGESADGVSKILNIGAKDFEAYCKDNNITVFAVNSDNSKQIKLTEKKTSFAQSIGSFNFLSDSEINSLMPDIIGNSEVKGEIISVNGQKLIKTHISSKDSGGEYSVMSFITVSNKTEYTLSFFTPIDQATEYIDNILETVRFEEIKSTTEKSGYRYVIIIGIILLTLVSGVIIFTLIKDIKNSKSNTYDEVR